MSISGCSLKEICSKLLETLSAHSSNLHYGKKININLWYFGGRLIISAEAKEEERANSRLNIHSYSDDVFPISTDSDNQLRFRPNVSPHALSLSRSLFFFSAEIQLPPSFFRKFCTPVTQLSTTVITLSVGISSDLNYRERGFGLPLHSSIGAQSIFTDSTLTSIRNDSGGLMAVTALRALPSVTLNLPLAVRQANPCLVIAALRFLQIMQLVN